MSVLLFKEKFMSYELKINGQKVEEKLTPEEIGNLAEKAAQGELNKDVKEIEIKIESRRKN